MLGFVSQQLISINSAVDKQESAEQKMIRLFLNNKVFSGGIEARHEATFSKETQQKLVELGHEIEEARESLDDKVLCEIMTPGLNPDVDRLISVLQACLEHPSSRCQHAKIGGSDGMLL